MLYSWLVVSIHIWLEQCFRRLKTKLMHQLSHLKCIQMQRFGRRKLVFLRGAKQGNSSWISAWMYQPTGYHTLAPSWCAGLAQGTISLPSRYEMQKAIYIERNSFPSLEMWFSPWGKVIALGWAHHMWAAVKWNRFYLLRSSNVDSIKQHSRTSQPFFAEAHRMMLFLNFLPSVWFCGRLSF